MTWHHVLVIVFAIGAVAFCGTHNSCHDVMPQLATLASGAIGGAMGNAMAATRERAKKKQAPRGGDGG